MVCRAPGHKSLVCDRDTMRMAPKECFGTPGGGEETGGSPFFSPPPPRWGLEDWSAGPTVEAGPAYSKPRPSVPGNCVYLLAWDRPCSTRGTPPPGQRCCIAWINSINTLSKIFCLKEKQNQPSKASLWPPHKCDTKSPSDSYLHDAWNPQDQRQCFVSHN